LPHTQAENPAINSALFAFSLMGYPQGPGTVPQRLMETSEDRQGRQTPASNNWRAARAGGSGGGAARLPACLLQPLSSSTLQRPQLVP
jgi:hypothetical protein